MPDTQADKRPHTYPFGASRHPCVRKGFGGRIVGYWSAILARDCDIDGHTARSKQGVWLWWSPLRCHQRPNHAFSTGLGSNRLFARSVAWLAPSWTV